MKHFMDLDHCEQVKIGGLFSNWLCQYTHDVICRVTAKVDEIINNDFAMKLLEELRLREDSERVDFELSIRYLMNNIDDKDYDPHNHPITHSRSYRDVLYDMYIKHL